MNECKKLINTDSTSNKFCKNNDYEAHGVKRSINTHVDVF